MVSFNMDLVLATLLVLTVGTALSGERGILPLEKSGSSWSSSAHRADPVNPFGPVQVGLFFQGLLDCFTLFVSPFGFNRGYEALSPEQREVVENQCPFFQQEGTPIVIKDR